MTLKQRFTQLQQQKAALKEVTSDVALIRNLTPVATSAIEVVTWPAPTKMPMVTILEASLTADFYTRIVLI